MTISTDLASSTDRYFGTGDGIESGAFLSRIEISKLPNLGVLIEYEATSHKQGVQHLEQTMLVPGPGGGAPRARNWWSNQRQTPASTPDQRQSPVR